MIISFVRSPRCVRCKRDCRREPKAYMDLSIPFPLLAWLTVRFRICQRCYDDIHQRAEANPKLRLIDGGHGDRPRGRR